MTKSTPPLTLGTLSVAFTLLIVSPADAVSINYGNFVGSSVRYGSVMETALSGDPEPLFGVPSLAGDTLEFSPIQFSASADNGSVDPTAGELDFLLLAFPGVAIKEISFSEGGDYGLRGTGTSATEVTYGLALTTVTVIEVDGIPLASPVGLANAAVSGGDNLSLGIDASTPWNLGLNYDVDAALAAASA